MRRLGRILLNTLTVLSLLTGLIVVAVWIRGRSAADWWQWHRTDETANTWRAWDVVGGRSGVYVSRQVFIFERPGHALEYAHRLERVNGFGHAVGAPQPNPYASGGSVWNRLGFAMVRDPLHYDPFSTDRYRYSFSRGHVPYWFILLVLAGSASPGVLGLYRRRRRARLLRSNRCLACGYDLRATPERCPECGEEARPTLRPVAP